jgi:tetratricopeptide (TPR) repeat protein
VGEALSALNQALSDSARLTARSAETAIEIVIEQAFCLAFLGRLSELVARLEEHLPQLEALNAPALAARFHFWWGFALMMMAKLREAEHQAERSLRYAVEADDSRGMGYAHGVLAYVCGTTGQCERGTAHATTATELLDALKAVPEARCLSWINLGLNRMQLGDWRGALAAAERAQAIGDAADSDRVRSLAASTIGYVYASSQQWQLALDATQVALAIGNDPFTLVQALTISAYSHAMSGRVQEAIAIAEPVIAQLELHGMHAFTCHALNVLAEARLRAGEPARACETASQAARSAQFAGDRRALGIALRVEGRAAQLLGESLAAREHLVEALHVFESFGARIEIANTLLALNELALAESNRELARSHLVRARSLYVECDVTRGVEDVDSLLATH